MARGVLLQSAEPVSLSMWTVYDHPRDMPDFFIARRWAIRAMKTMPTKDVIRDTDLEAVRDRLRTMGLHQLARNAADDLVIIETWI